MQAGGGWGVGGGDRRRLAGVLAFQEDGRFSRRVMKRMGRRDDGPGERHSRRRITA
jgi:hypothetical protein